MMIFFFADIAPKNTNFVTIYVKQNRFAPVPSQNIAIRILRYRNNSLEIFLSTLPVKYYL